MIIEEFEISDTYNYNRHKQSTNVSCINITLHPRGLFTPVSITLYHMSGFQQKFTSHDKK